MKHQSSGGCWEPSVQTATSECVQRSRCQPNMSGPGANVLLTDFFSGFLWMFLWGGKEVC